MHKGFLFLSSLLLLLCCGDGPKENIGDAYANTNIDPEFIRFVDSFLEEASLRSIDVDISSVGLEIQFGEVESTGDVLGSCNRDSHSIIVSEADWNNLSENHREVLIFHELGHCIFDRDHKTAQLRNGEAASIMWPSIQGKFFGVRRSYYLDEFFWPSNPEPNWVHKTATYRVPFSRDSIRYKDELINFNEKISIDSTRDFEIEFTMETLPGAKSGLAWGSANLKSAIFITAQKPMQIDIETGRRLYGRIYHEPFSNIANKDTNKITIRKLDEEYFFFVNEEFIFWMEFIPFEDDSFQTFTATRDGLVDLDAPVKITDLKINYLD